MLAAELHVCGLLLLVLADEHIDQLSRHGYAISVCKQVSATHAPLLRHLHFSARVEVCGLVT